MAPLDPRTAALVLIDLQQGIVGVPLAPRSGNDVLSASRTLAERFRGAGAPVVLVRVTFADNYADAPPANVDSPMQLPPGGLPEAWSRLADGLAAPGDIHIVKRQWGAFHGTELDLQLRRRGIRTVVVGGIATNMGVESTVRAAWELGYGVVVAEDLCATHTPDMQAFAFQHIFPRIARVTTSPEIVFA